jgi:hypothetical protein
MEKKIVVGNSGGSISLKYWHESLNKLEGLGYNVSDFPRYSNERFRYLHVQDNRITFGEFDSNCENVVKVKDFLKNL